MDITEIQIKLWQESLESILKPHRYRHCLNTAIYAQKLALRHCQNPEKAYVAGLLHDIGRQYNEQELLEEAARLSIKIGPAEQKNPLILHAPLGACFLATEWGIIDSEILAAVAEHTIARPAMSSLSKIVFLADLLEPAREAPNLDPLRKLALNNLDQAMLAAISNSIIWLKEHHSYIHESIWLARHYFRRKIKETPKPLKLQA